MTVMFSKLWGWKTRINRTMDAPVSRPPAASKPMIRIFFFVAICREYVLRITSIRFVTRVEMCNLGFQSTYSTIGKIKTTKSVSTEIIVSFIKTFFTSIHFAGTVLSHNPDMGLQMPALIPMIGM